MNSVASTTTTPQTPVWAMRADDYNEGWQAYYCGKKRSILVNEEMRRGYDDARGEMNYHRAMLAEAGAA